ncbi:MAG: hypothetical protein LBB31_01435 [Prevotellaceae bacterium]|jgi:hypothetical protein|nr:hypothetical protein [Prevotellaceae bacterium]
MNLFEPKQKITFSGFFRKHSTGIYGTVIFHLIVAIILISSQIYSYTVDAREAIVLVIPPDEEAFIAAAVRPPQTTPTAVSTPADKREQLSKELDRLIAGGTPPRNVAVDASQRSQPLRDDRNTNVSQLYGEAREVQQRIDAARREAALRQGSDDIVTTPAAPPAKESYKGPSVLSYDLGGRKHLSLPVPVYQCFGGGDVTVQIEVNQRGYVTNVSVQVAASVDNTCLYEAAKRAALRSRFTIDANAPAKQTGTIVYRFIPQ